MTWALASFALGMAAQWALSRYGVMKRQASRRELAFELRNPVDLLLNDLSGSWEARR